MQYQSQTQLGLVHVLPVPSTEYLHYRDYYCNRQKDRSTSCNAPGLWQGCSVLIRIPLKYWRQVVLPWNFGICISREWGFIIKVHDKTSLSRACCRTQTSINSKYPHQAFFSPKISANAMEAIKYFKHTAQISWKYSKNISVFKLFPSLLKRYHILFFT